MTPKVSFSLFLSLSLIPYLGSAAENLIDHKLPLNTGGIYRTQIQDAVPIALGAITLAGALSEGSESRLGRTFWKSGESMIFAGALAEGLGRVTRRQRPSDSDNANNWFEGKSSEGSFPSSHVAATAAAVTPFIMEYSKDYPWTMSLAALPVYEMVARVKSQKHWQTDVVVGAALGVAVGAYEHSADKPWIVSLMPGGVFVGFRKALP